MKRRNLLQISTIVLLTTALFVVWNSVDTSSADESIVAYRADGSLTLDGEADEAIWENATSVILDTYGGFTDVQLKFMHNTTHMFFYAEWSDVTQNNTRNGWDLDITDYVNLGGNEDRITLAWAIGGATISCGHSPGGTDMLFDVWHWKASRTAPGGWTDDKYWDGTGRHGDAKTAGGYMDNSVVAQAASPTEITDKLGNSTNVAAFGDGDLPYWFENGTEIAWSSGSVSGTLPDFVPGYQTSVPDGSRGDVLAASIYEGSEWQVEEVRAFDTGNSDDVLFEAGMDYEFYVAIHDGSGGSAHYREASNTITLSLSNDYSEAPVIVEVPTTVYEPTTVIETTTEAGFSFIATNLLIFSSILLVVYSKKRKR